MDYYYTISETSKGIYKEKGSKFHSFVIPVYTVEKAKELIKTYKKEFFDARHVCYAYSIGTENIDWKINDDGEPNGTAGRPIMGQIKSKDLTNILIIVVRYFGGVLLGTGGLVNAYKEATLDALNNSKIIKKAVEETIDIEFNYLNMNDIMKIIKDFNLEISTQDYGNICKLTIIVKKEFEDIILSKFSNIESLKFKMIE